MYQWFIISSTTGAIGTHEQSQSPMINNMFDSNLVPTGFTVIGPYDGTNPMPSSYQTAWNNPQAYLYQNDSFVANPNWQSVQIQATKNNRIAYLNSQYVQTLAKGFTSSALGTTYTYCLSDSDEKEWKALNVAITRNAYPSTGYALKCYDSTGAVQYITHTQTQAEQVLFDGSTFGLNQLSNLRTKTNNVNAIQLANYATLQDAENAVNAITY